MFTFTHKKARKLIAPIFSKQALESTFEVKQMRLPSL